MTGNEAIVFKNGTIIETKRDGVDLVRGCTPPPPFQFDECDITHSPEIQKAIDNIMSRLAQENNHIILTSTPMQEPGFFYQMWEKTKK